MLIRCFFSNPFIQFYKIILYFIRKYQVKYVTIDGSFYVTSKTKITYIPKLLMLFMHKIKNKLFIKK